MAGEVSVTPDPRGRAWRAFLMVSAVLSGLLGLLLLGFGLVGIGTGIGQTLVCFGLVLLVTAAGGFARERAERAHDRHPPQPELTTAPTGEPALFLPRSAGRARVAVGVLLGLATVAGLGALFAVLAGGWPGALVLAVVAVLLGVVAAPGSAAGGAGGLWFTPQRLVSVHDGVRWDLPWEDVSGVVPHEPMPILVHPGREPKIQRTAAAGRFRGRARVDGMLPVETRYLAGGATLAAYVVGKAVVDPAFRAALGSPTSLPPTNVA
jgi:hypothetical protein